VTDVARSYGVKIQQVTHSVAQAEPAFDPRCPILGSVPANKRRMFSWCRAITMSAIAKVSQATLLSARNTAATGAATHATSDASEDIRAVTATISHTMPATKATGQVADDGAQSCPKCGVRRPKITEHANRKSPFRGIKQQCRRGKAFMSSTQYIGCTNIAGTDGSDVS
jgi:hypothetical protein